MSKRRNDNTLVLARGKHREWTPHDLRRTGSTLTQRLGVPEHRGGSGCLNTELAWISGALRVWHRCRVVHGGGRASLAT